VAARRYTRTPHPPYTHRLCEHRMRIARLLPPPTLGMSNLQSSAGPRNRARLADHRGPQPAGCIRIAGNHHRQHAGARRP
jgi:hypothetical protein